MLMTMIGRGYSVSMALHQEGPGNGEGPRGSTRLHSTGPSVRERPAAQYALENTMRPARLTGDDARPAPA